MRLLVWILILGATIAGCSDNQRPVVSPVDSSECARACSTLRTAHCPEGDTVRGVTCETVCKSAEALLPVACIAAALPTQEAVRACGRVRCGQAGAP